MALHRQWPKRFTESDISSPRMVSPLESAARPALFKSRSQMLKKEDWGEDEFGQRTE